MQEEKFTGESLPVLPLLSLLKHIHLHKYSLATGNAIYTRVQCIYMQAHLADMVNIQDNKVPDVHEELQCCQVVCTEAAQSQTSCLNVLIVAAEHFCF